MNRCSASSSELCRFDGLPRVLVVRQGRVVVHLQAGFAAPPDHLLVLLLAALAALAAAAAVFPAEAEHGGHHSVPGRQRAHGPRQEFPGAEAFREEAGAARLHHVDDDDEDDQQDDGSADAQQDRPAGQRQAEHAQGEDQEAQDEVEAGKPAVFGCFVAKASGQPDGHPHERDGVPEQDPHDVEEEVAQCNLQQEQHTHMGMSVLFQES